MARIIPVKELFNGLINGSRASLSRAITLVESTAQRSERHQLMKLVLEHKQQTLSTQDGKHDAQKGHEIHRSLRIAITGGPGAGKSSFIESMGLKLVESDPSRKVAVLAVDPSSALTGGSLLADKTRMQRLTSHPQAYIRPSPNRGHYGGVTRSTMEAIWLCEMAGYDIVFIETVGVGQSEYQVRNLCDVFTLLVAPSGGDEIQAIKKGIMELANLIVVTKSDGDLVKHSRRMSADILSATKYFPVGQRPTVIRCSAHSGDGIDDVWKAIEEFSADQDQVETRRQKQKVNLLRDYLTNALLDELNSKLDLKSFEDEILSNKQAFIFEMVDRILSRVHIDSNK